MDQRKFVYDFEEGSKEMKTILGGKGAGLAEMTKSAFPYLPVSRFRLRCAPSTLRSATSLRL